MTDSGDVAAHVYRALTRRRAEAQQVPGWAFGPTQARLREQGYTGLLKFELPGGNLGWMLLEGGQLLHARHAGRPDADAESALNQQARHSTIHTFALDGAHAVLAQAAAQGQAEVLAQPTPLDARAVLDGLTSARYEGALLLERGTQTLAWHLRGAQAPLGPAVPERLSGLRQTLLRWSGAAPVPAPFTPAQLADQPLLESVTEPLQPATLPASLVVPAPLAGAAMASTDLLWRTFEQDMLAQLDERAPRFVRVLRQEYAAQHDPHLLLHTLAWQVERVSGPAAALDFKRRLSTPPEQP